MMGCGVGEVGVGVGLTAGLWPGRNICKNHTVRSVSSHPSEKAAPLMWNRSFRCNFQVLLPHLKKNNVIIIFLGQTQLHLI